MWNNDTPDLPDWIQKAYETLEPHIAESQDGIPPERARELLLADGEFPDEPADCDYAIDRLLQRGWLYEVDGLLRKTD